MSQRQYTTYQSDILSFELRDALIGILNPGRYYGFNTMTEYQTQSGNNVYCRVSGGGIAKYNQTYPTPVLETNRGILITTQGTIITEDGNVDFTITLSAPAGIKWHILYAEHAFYSGVPGANPAIYGIKSGTIEAGIPSLDYPTKQIPVGYIKETIGAVNFEDLIYYKANVSQNYGDQNIAAKLWGTGLATKILDEGPAGDVGTIPGDGVVGNRQFTEQNFITNLQSITDSLDGLDQQVKINASDIITLGGKKLDEWATPTDVTTLNATTGYHGLLPKLSGVSSEFLNGNGAWVAPIGSSMIMRTGTFSIDTTLTSSSPDETIVDYSSIVPVGATAIILRVNLWTTVGLPSLDAVSAMLSKESSSSYHNIIYGFNGTAAAAPARVYSQCIIPCTTGRTLCVKLANKTYLWSLDIAVVGWQLVG